MHSIWMEYVKILRIVVILEELLIFFANFLNFYKV